MVCRVAGVLKCVKDPRMICYSGKCGSCKCGAQAHVALTAAVGQAGLWFPLSRWKSGGSQVKSLAHVRTARKHTW